jgi:formylglycine-generating enzyme required for sulfatase activity
MKSRSRSLAILLLTVPLFGIVVSFPLAEAARAASFAASPFCETIFAPTESEIEAVIFSLAKLRLQLDVSKAEGTWSLSKRALDQEYFKKEQKLIEALEKSKSGDRSQVLEKIRGQIAILQGKNKKHEETERKEREKEADAREDIEVPGVPGEAFFNNVEPGTFQMGAKGMTTPVTIERPFKLMSIPTTVGVFMAVKQLAESHFPGRYLLTMQDRFVMHSLTPATGIEYQTVLSWIEALNELSKAGAPELKNILKGHKKGDVYRLPTSEEWEFVLSNRGQHSDLPPGRTTAKTIGAIAWTQENTGGAIQKVATKEPLMLADGEYYDLLGNVREFVGVPLGAKPLLRGGGYLDPYHSPLNRTYGKLQASMPSAREDVGYRLVREARR